MNLSGFIPTSFFLICNISIVFSQTEIEIDSLLKLNQIDDAKEFISLFHKKNPKLASAQYFFAITRTSGTQSYFLYNRIINNKSASDSLKGEAFYRIGSYYFCKKEYSKALENLSKAEKYRKDGKISRLKILSNIATRSFSKGFDYLELNYKSFCFLRPEQYFYFKGLLLYNMKKYEKADSIFSQSLIYQPDSSINISALIGKLLNFKTAPKIEYQEESKLVLYFQSFPQLLESSILHASSDSLKKSKESPENGKKQKITDTSRVTSTTNTSKIQNQQPLSPESNLSESKEGQILYTIQIGAFLNKKNAENLCARLKRKQLDATISTEKKGADSIYKVLIGTFQTEASAREFIKNSLNTSGVANNGIVKKK